MKTRMTEGPPPLPADDMQSILRDLREANENLIVANLRSQDLAIELTRLYEQATETIHAKDDFFEQVSHELRTPMTTITGWSSLLQINPDPDTAAEAIRCIARSAAIQAKLVNDLLDMARINSRKFPITKSEIDLTKVAAEAIVGSRLSANAKRVAMTLNAPEPVVVQGDDIRMRQVMDNLLSNAVKFTTEGGSIEVEVMLEEGTAIIRVHDNGEGIPAAILPHVFDRHAQATAYRFGGLGLGLAIVHQIVELHGGSVTAESPGPGLGSTLTVRLPGARPGHN